MSAFSLILPRREASFHSLLLLSDAKKRLNESFVPDTFAKNMKNAFKDAVFIKEEGKFYRIRRHTPWLQNAFRPIFYGTFLSFGETGVTLKGEFRMPRASLCFILVWLFIATLIPLFSAFKTLSTMALFFAIFMPCFGFMLVQCGWWISVRDIEIISQALKKALK